MRARLRCFDPADWGAGPEPSHQDMYQAHRRYTTAWLTWCGEHSVSPLDALLERRRLREFRSPHRSSNPLTPGLFVRLPRVGGPGLPGLMQTQRFFCNLWNAPATPEL